MKKNIVIFSGSNKPNYFNEIEKDLIIISNNIDVEKYNLYYGGGESGLMGVIPYNFHKRNGKVYGIDAKQFVFEYLWTYIENLTENGTFVILFPKQRAQR